MKKRRKLKKSVWVSLLAIFFMFVFGLFTLSKLEKKPPEEKVEDVQEVYREEFIEAIKEQAITLGTSYGIKPSIIISQAILESDFGQSVLAKKYKNLFGIKAYGKVPKIALDTKEFVDEKWITIKGEFRVYDSWKESLKAHTQLFVKGVDWNPKLYAKVFTAKDYKEAAKEIQKAGYATDPQYAQKLIQVIEEYQLAQYDS